MTDDIVQLNFGLLNEWYCVSKDASEDSVAKSIRLAAPPGIPLDLVKDRLFGGFKCDKADRRHVNFECGHYTYTQPEANTPMCVDERHTIWKRLLDPHDENNFIGGGPFCADAPGKEGGGDEGQRR